jgi:DNA invertase Pin-like site-specific DNA recombinase
MSPSKARRFVAYYRVSTHRQGKSGLGLEAQRKAVLDYLNGGAWELVEEYTEHETGKRSDRPELQKALEACRRQRATLVIAKLDRLARNTAFLLTIIDSGVNVLFCDLPHVSGAMGRFLVTQMAAVAELEAGISRVMAHKS